MVWSPPLLLHDFHHGASRHEQRLRFEMRTPAAVRRPALWPRREAALDESAFPLREAGSYRESHPRRLAQRVRKPCRKADQRRRMKTLEREAPSEHRFRWRCSRSSPSRLQPARRRECRLLGRGPAHKAAERMERLQSDASLPESARHRPLRARATALVRSLRGSLLQRACRWKMVPGPKPLPTSGKATSDPGLPPCLHLRSLADLDPSPRLRRLCRTPGWGHAC
mmetsp:Transcript_3223/g.7680  ORF Transcript_3223/g.7680 Transcript_3223/m.7680 type:complete len:225 (+) Transcript_3223:432-1106(+)